jgi:undecaprenyl diphosphate synthase
MTYLAPLHVALIMDGNGRWAADRGLPRNAGHRAGAAAVRRLVEAAPALGVGMLSLFAFSSDNWRRPAGEIRHLMDLLRAFLEDEVGRWVATGVRVSAIGRRDRLPRELIAAIQAAEAATAQCRRLHLRLAIDYSARDAIVAASQQRPIGREAFARALTGHAETADVDLLIRTGGEQRLSDFLLWECAYAELHFTEVRWPDFTATHLAVAIEEFRRRPRRFGGLEEAAARDDAARSESTAKHTS